MATSPYMPFYFSDYFADTAHLSKPEHASYLFMISVYWQTGKPLPNDDDKLARITRSTSEEWLEMKDTLLEFFTVVERSLVHKRIEVELEYYRKKIADASKAGKASAEVRNQHKTNDRSTTVQRPYQRNGNQSESESEILKDSLSQTREAEKNDHIADVDKMVEHIENIEELAPATKHGFVSPSQEDVSKEFERQGRVECAIAFYEHWAGVDWRDPQNRRIDWRMRIGAWLRRENNNIMQKPLPTQRGSPVSRVNMTADELFRQTGEEMKRLGIAC